MANEEKEIKLRISSDTRDAINDLSKYLSVLNKGLKDATKTTEKEVKEQKGLWKGLFSDIKTAAGDQLTKSFAVATIATDALRASFGKLAEAIKFVVSGSVRAAAEMETLRVTLSAIVGSNFSNKLLKDFKELSQTAPVDIKNLAEGSIRLKAMGIENEKLSSTMRVLSNLTAMYGEEKLPFLVLALGQITTKTKLYAQELRQFQEAGVPLLDRLSKMMGKSVAEIQKGMETGDIVVSSRMVLRVLEDISKETDVLSARSNTLSGQWKMLKTDAYLLGNEIGSKLNPILTEAIRTFRSLYRSNENNKAFETKPLYDYAEGITTVAEANNRLKEATRELAGMRKWEQDEAAKWAVKQKELEIKALEERKAELLKEDQFKKELREKEREEKIKLIEKELNEELNYLKTYKSQFTEKKQLIQEELSIKEKAIELLSREGDTSSKLFKNLLVSIKSLKYQLDKMSSDKSEEKLSDKIKSVSKNYEDLKKNIEDTSDANADNNLSIEETNDKLTSLITLTRDYITRLITLRNETKSGSDEYKSLSEKIDESNKNITKYNKLLGENKIVTSEAKKESFALAESIEALTGDLADLFTGKFESSKLINVLTNEMSKSLRSSLQNSLQNIGANGIVSVFNQLVAPTLGMFGLQLFGNILTEILGQNPRETVAERTARIADETFDKLIKSTNEKLNDLGREKNIVDYIESLMQRYGETATFGKLTQQEQSFFRATTGLAPQSGVSLQSLLVSASQNVQQGQYQNVQTILSQMADINEMIRWEKSQISERESILSGNYSENLKRYFELSKSQFVRQEDLDIAQSQLNSNEALFVRQNLSEAGLREWIQIAKDNIAGYEKTLTELRPRVIESAAQYTQLGTSADIAATPIKTEKQKIAEEYSEDLNYAETVGRQYGYNSEEYYNAMSSANKSYSNRLLQMGISGGETTSAVSNYRKYDALLDQLRNPPKSPAEVSQPPVEELKISDFAKAQRELDIDLAQANKYAVGSSEYYEARSRAYRKYGDKLIEIKQEGGTGIPDNIDSLISGAYSTGASEYGLANPTVPEKISTSSSSSGINISASDLARYANDPAQLGYLAMGGKNTKNVSSAGFTPSYLVGGSTSGQNVYASSGLNITINVGMLLGNQNDAISIGKQIIDAVNKALASGQGYKLNV